MTQDSCTIQVNGREFEARPGQMLIEVTDAAGIYIPRFCYHAKLSIAANCRMCLVEVENAPKPMPACATPVTPGMKVHTRSEKALGAQKATMEFLLINHPLDCPICDQGGECELQDLAMGFGRDVSRYTERKRVVRDKDIGPLVSTDMTRCIHCTRCVRFTQEIAGFQELGTIGRGDRVEIAPYIERGVTHELSGNIIDLCPVGALNSKPFRFSARAWEMTQRPTIAPHDCLGSHLYAHVMDGSVKRVVPRPCESLNETWISDRDRFSYEGIYARDRVREPMIRADDGWREASWDEALEAVAAELTSGRGTGNVGALLSPCTTTEEGYLLARLLEHLGSANIDYRLRRRDFRSQEGDPLFPSLGMPIAEIPELQQLLVVGSNLRGEVPLLAHRVRMATLRGAQVHFVNPAEYRYLFPVASYANGRPSDFWLELATLLRAATGHSSGRQDSSSGIIGRAPAPTERHQRLVEALRAATNSAVFLGQLSQRHPDFALIEFLAGELCQATGSTLGYITEGANAAGLALAGALPHRTVAGARRESAGATAAQMLASPPSVLVLHGLEIEADCADGQRALDACRQARSVVALTSYLTDAIRGVARVVLPLAGFAEHSGTYVNGEGRWQSFDAVAKPVGNARPGWKILRMLGTRIGVPGFNFASSEVVRDEVRKACEGVLSDAASRPRVAPAATIADDALPLAALDVPIYQVDALVRRAVSLQRTAGVGSAEAPVTERRRA